MKFYSFQVNGPTGKMDRLGVEICGKLVDINAAGKELYQAKGEFAPQAVADFFLPSDLKVFLERGAYAKEAVKELIAWIGTPGDAYYVYDKDTVKLLPPVKRPGILLDCMLYEEHLKHHRPEISEIYYKRPFWSSQCTGTVIGSGDPIIKPFFTKWFDFELEVGFYIGKKGLNIPEDKAMEYVAGYTFLNDISARDIQVEESQIRMGPTKGKWFEHGNIMGPCMVTPDEIPDINGLTLQAYLNGELVVEDKSGPTVQTVAQVIAYASREATLYPGDFIALGTTKDGTCINSKAARWLKVGDEVRFHCDQIGDIVNKVEASPIPTMYPEEE